MPLPVRISSSKADSSWMKPLKRLKLDQIKHLLEVHGVNRHIWDVEASTEVKQQRKTTSYHMSLTRKSKMMCVCVCVLQNGQEINGLIKLYCR